MERAPEPTTMPNRNQRRARPCFTPARGKTTSDIAPRADRTRLYQSLCADPVLVLNLLPSSNIGHLSELEGWSAFCRSHPDEAQRVIDIAQKMGISEKPPKRRRR